MVVRVRFAPSPTGNLHLGGFRTALLNFLFARKNQGKFILRVEDTDQARTIPGAAEQLEEDLSWLGITPDESPRQGGGHGPYVQSQRLPHYHKYLDTLVENSSMYECFCSEKRLELIRGDARRVKATPGYDNKCRALTRSQVVRKKAAGEKHVYRLKLDSSPVEFEDVLYGKINLVDKNDPVMIKSDGFPTYHYANVIDDRLMEITHVLRGLEWQISTGIHLQLYRALGWQPPAFAHLPVLLNNDGTKLSKRSGDTTIASYRSAGCAPLTLANFVTKSGGGFYHSVDKLFTMAEQFDLHHLNSNPCQLDFNLLEELKRLHTQKEIEYNFDGVLQELRRKHPDVAEDYLRRVITWAKPRIKILTDLDAMSYLWTSPQDLRLNTPAEILRAFADSDLELSHFIQTHTSVNKKQFMKDLRFILSGLKEGPPIAELIQLLGNDVVKSRIQSAVSKL